MRTKNILQNKISVRFSILFSFCRPFSFGNALNAFSTIGLSYTPVLIHHGSCYPFSEKNFKFIKKKYSAFVPNYIQKRLFFMLMRVNFKPGCLLEFSDNFKRLGKPKQEAEKILQLPKFLIWVFKT